MTNPANNNIYYQLQDQPNRIYVIADASLHHGGNKERALALVRAAKWSGADAVEFQVFKADQSVAAKPKGQPDQDLSGKMEICVDTLHALCKEAQRIGIEFISTPFDQESADFLDELGVSAFKIAAKDMTNRPLIEHISRKGKPVLLSGAMSTSGEIEKAIDWMHMQSNEQVVLLHCPAEPQELNLRSVQYLRDRFGIPVGFSDHSAVPLRSIVATSLGAQVIERHFMIESRADTSEHISMEARQFKSHIAELRLVSESLGDRAKSTYEPEIRTKPARRRALYARNPHRTRRSRGISGSSASPFMPAKWPDQRMLAVNKLAV